MKSVRSIEKAGRQVVMAGLGVVGLSKDMAAHKIDTLMDGFNSLVNELLTRGESLENEMEVKDRMQTIKDRRIAQIRKQLGLANNPQTSDLDNLSHKLDELTKVITKLVDQKQAAQKAESATEAAAKKGVADKVKATPAKRTTSRTAAAKKAVTKTATAKTTAKETGAEKKATTASKVASKPVASSTRTKKATGETKTPTRRASSAAKVNTAQTAAEKAKKPINSSVENKVIEPSGNSNQDNSGHES